MHVSTLFILAFLPIFANALISSVNSSKTFLYFGYALGNLHGDNNTKLATDDTLPAHTFLTAPTFSASGSIVTIEATPNQVPFPLEVIPPSSSDINTRDMNNPRIPPDAEILPPSGLEPLDIVRPLSVPPSAPTAPALQRPHLTTPPKPKAIHIRPTVSTNTALFPKFDIPPTGPASEGAASTVLTSGTQKRPPVSPLAQNFPQTIPLPSAPSAPSAPGIGRPQCSCVTAGTCITRTLGGVVDVRVVTQSGGVSCQAGQQYCCSSTPNLPQQDTCGLPNIIPGVFPTAGQAGFGEFPWSAIILNSAGNYQGGAVLISNLHLLTAAHLVFANPIGITIRLGEWDLAGTYEPISFVEYNVASVVIHPSYTPVTLQNDLAVITLATPATLLNAPTPQVNTACLPPPGAVFTGSGCLVAGWGRESWNGNYQNIMKKVDLQVTANLECQTRLRGTKLGPAWNLDTTSFICAGGEAAKDACTGDGGNALVCPVNGRFVIAGITAGGVECGLPGVPGLYVNVGNYLDWINQQTFVPPPPPPAGNIDPRKGNFGR